MRRRNRESEFFWGVGMKCHVISHGKQGRTLVPSLSCLAAGKGMVAEVGEAIDFP
jgi:hypothetical protein